MLSRCLPGTGSYYISAEEVLEIKATSPQLHGHVTAILQNRRPCCGVPHRSPPGSIFSMAPEDA